MKFIKKIISLFWRKPDVIIGRKGDDVYLRRWWVIPKNKLFNIYLHNFLLSDLDTYLHSHPFSFNISILLSGKYLEHLPDDVNKWKKNESREEIVKTRYPFVPILRIGESIHRIELFEENGKPKTIWTLFVSGPVVRPWGFICPFGFRDHNEFLQKTDEHSSITGKGCD